MFPKFVRSFNLIANHLLTVKINNKYKTLTKLRKKFKTPTKTFSGYASAHKLKIQLNNNINFEQKSFNVIQYF